MWENVITASAVVGVLTSLIALVRIAVGSERRRADDWRKAAETSREANDVLARHVEKLVSAVDQMSATQREMMVLLRNIATDQGVGR